MLTNLGSREEPQGQQQHHLHPEIPLGSYKGLSFWFDLILVLARSLAQPCGVSSRLSGHLLGDCTWIKISDAAL